MDDFLPIHNTYNRDTHCPKRNNSDYTMNLDNHYAKRYLLKRTLRRLERVFRCCSVCETMEDYKEGYLMVWTNYISSCSSIVGLYSWLNIFKENAFYGLQKILLVSFPRNFYIWSAIVNGTWMQKIKIGQRAKFRAKSKCFPQISFPVRAILRSV